MPSKPTALFIGRFQPFHTGHLLVVQGMVKVSGKVIIAIGSSQESGTEKNPFTTEERREMIQRTLQTENVIPLYDVNFIEVPDQKDDAEWTKHILELAGSVDKLWTGDEKTKKCFEGTGIEVQDIKEVPGINGTDIRCMMKEGGDWKEKVPTDVHVYLKEIHGVNRVKSA